MQFLPKFINLMKHEHTAKKKRFAWVLDEGKYLKIHEVRILRRTCLKERETALKQGESIPIRDWFMIELGLNTGLRVDEMSELKCGDISEMLVKVRMGKGGKPGTVRINEDFRNECTWFLRWKKSNKQGIEKEDFIFSKDNGAKLTKRALQKAFKRCMKKAGLPEHYSIHSLRHTYGAHLYLASNHNLRLVQEQLRHSSVKVTEVYVSLMDSDTRKALDKLYK